MHKIKEKVEYSSVVAQGSYSCEHDCVTYSNTKSTNMKSNVCNGPAITYCGCMSKKITSASGWSAW